MKKTQLVLNVFVLTMTILSTCLGYSQITPLNPHVLKQEITGPEEKEDQYFLDVALGKITEQQFKEMHARFATQAIEDYDSQKTYKLMDFLPSFVQKTNGKVLVPHSISADRQLLRSLQAQEKPTDGQAYVDANCHSVTWQWVNHMQGRGSSEAVLTLMDGDTLLEETQTMLDVSIDKIQPADILLVKGDGAFGQTDAILHSAVYLGWGFVFEKPNPGKEYIYRISYLKDVIAKYKKVDENVEFIFRRNLPPSRILKTPIEELSLLSDHNQRSHSITLQNISSAVLSGYQLQESWGGSESIFTLGSILKTSEVSPKKFYSIK